MWGIWCASPASPTREALPPAARSLGETPKQTSRRVARLEETIGTRLFHRTTRAVRLTAEGVVYLESVSGMLESLTVAREKVGAAEAVAGRVRVQVVSMLIEPVASWLHQALGQHPELEVELLVEETMSKTWCAKDSMWCSRPSRPPARAWP